MSTKISIIGAAGTLGSCTAFRIADQGLADDLILFDQNRNLLRNHLMDIETAITGSQNTKISEGSEEDLAGSDIVIITAGAPWRVVSSRQERLQENIPIIKELAEKIKKHCPQAVVITVTNPVDPLNLALNHFSGLDPKKLLGYSLNDTTRFKMLVAKALGIQSTQIQGTVIGEHGDYAVLLFSSLRQDGKPVSLNKELKEKIRQEHRDTLKTYFSLKISRTSGWASSVGLTSMVSAIIRESEEAIPCSVLLQGEYGIDGISISLPVKLGREGVREIVEVELSPEEKESLEKSAKYLQQISHFSR